MGVMADEWRYEPLQSLPPDALATNSWLMNAMRNHAYGWIRRWLKRRFDFQVHGDDAFQRVPQFVLIANHTSHLDTICLLAALPSMKRNHCFSAAAEDYFYTHLFKEQVARLLGNTFPFRRHEDAQRSLEACARILERGDSLIFFPEGTRSQTGDLQRFRKGIGLLVQGKPYPVIPTHLQGAHEALAKGRFRPGKAAIRLQIGSPEYFASAQPGEASAIDIANHLHDRVRALKP